MKKTIKIFRRKEDSSRELVNEISMSLTAKECNDVFAFLRKINMLQREKDVLKLGGPCKIDDAYLGIGRMSTLTEQSMLTTMDGKAGTTFYEDGSFKLPAREEDVDQVWQKPIEVNGKEYYYGFEMYSLGYLISAGIYGTNILGGRRELYLDYVGKARTRISSRATAKIFPTPKNLATFVENNRWAFKSFREDRPDIQWSICFANKYSEEKFAELKQKEQDAIDRVNEILSEINEGEAEKKLFDENIPDKYSDEAAFNEVMLRMKKFDLWKPVIDRYKKDKGLFMSMGGGMLYDLNDRAKEAAQKVIDEYGYIPYHIIYNELDGMPMYSVLYVSNHPEEWVYERPQDGGYLTAAVDGFNFEFGEIKVESANGGLVRTM